MNAEEALDRRMMRRALELAARGDYRTHPNPKVGCVIARDEEVLAEGYHAVSGEAHAEAAALQALAGAGRDARGATVYVTLEPCGPFPGKRTPPCVGALRRAAPARVVVATRDPHPAIGGSSLALLRAEGIAVVEGVEEEAARRLIAPYAKWVQHERPFVIAKWAMSLDGKIACRGGHSQWISGEASRRGVHRLRGEVCAIAVGSGTALADDPRLTRRGVPGRDPLRIVLDTRARLPVDGQLVRSAGEVPLLVLTGVSAPAERCEALAAAGAEVLRLPEAGGHVDPDAALVALGARGVRQLLVEGGGELLAAWFAADLIDRVFCFVAPRILGGEGAPSPVRGLGVARVDAGPRLSGFAAAPSGEDVLLRGDLHRY